MGLRIFRLFSASRASKLSGPKMCCRQVKNNKCIIDHVKRLPTNAVVFTVTGCLMNFLIMG